MGDVVMITGASKRLGRAIVTALAESGYTTIIHTRRADDGVRALSEELGGSCAVVEGDLTDMQGLGPLFDRAVSLFGHVDHLINSASSFFPLSIEETTVEEFDRLMALHNTAPFFLSRALYLHLKERGGQGSIINIGDATLTAPRASKPAYYTAKGALVAQSRALSVALAPTVRVNVISPGPVLPSEDDHAYFARMENLLPLRRTGASGDIIQAVSYLLSASFVTGTELVVDGGLTLL
jgi:pteridine reductase